MGSVHAIIKLRSILTLYFNCIFVFLMCRTLQYGQMAMSTDSEETIIVKQNVEAKGEKGLLNLPAEETVFYVGSYPSTFTVSNAKPVSMEQNVKNTLEWTLLT